jgi:hypothetical protein
MSNSTSGNNQQQQQITSIPTSTVVAIGGGFVAFAFCVFTFLSLIRVFRIFRQSRRVTPRISFRQAWRDDGGFWGFFSGMALASRETGNMLLGVGARDLRGWGLWEELRAWEIFEREKNMKNPEMWEVELKGGNAEDRVSGLDNTFAVSRGDLRTIRGAGH